MANAQTLQVLVRILFDDGIVASMAIPPDALQPDAFMASPDPAVTDTAVRLLRSQSELLAVNLAESGLAGIHQQATATTVAQRAEIRSRAAIAELRRGPSDWPPRPANLPSELFLTAQEPTPMAAHLTPLAAVAAALQRDMTQASSPIVAVQSSAAALTFSHRDEQGKRTAYRVTVLPVAQGPDAPDEAPAKTAGPAVGTPAGLADGQAAGG
jgi:hypothetical protein